MKPRSHTSLYDGTKAVNRTLLSRLNQDYINWATPKIPPFIETYHLTAMTYLWAGLSFLSGYLAQDHTPWLWLMSGSIIGHYLTDALDGEIGRRRQTGLTRWGFYVDHFGDFVYAVSIFVGLSYTIPHTLFRRLLILTGIWAAFFINNYLLWIVKRKYNPSFFGIGTTEIQFFFAFMIGFFALFGSSVLIITLRIMVPLSVVGLAIVFISTQYQLWIKDMRAKNRLRRSQKHLTSDNNHSK